MLDAQISVAGNLVADPELAYTNTGTPVAKFRVAVNRRTYDKNAGQWVDSEPTYLRCTAWRELGENIAAELTKGASVIVIGDLRSRAYEDKQGNRRTAYEVDVKAAGPNLRWATPPGQQGQTGAVDDSGNGGAFSGGDDAPPF